LRLECGSERLELCEITTAAILLERYADGGESGADDSRLASSQRDRSDCIDRALDEYRRRLGKRDTDTA
jgi:hypothetical protein